MKTIEERLACFGQRLYEAAIPCALLMVQGKVFALTPKHILIAMKTGVITGAFATLLTFIPFLKKHYNNEIILSFVIFGSNISCSQSALSSRNVSTSSLLVNS